MTEPDIFLLAMEKGLAKNVVVTHLQRKGDIALRGSDLNLFKHFKNTSLCCGIYKFYFLITVICPNICTKCMYQVVLPCLTSW